MIVPSRPTVARASTVAEPSSLPAFIAWPTATWNVPVAPVWSPITPVIRTLAVPAPNAAY